MTTRATTPAPTRRPARRGRTARTVRRTVRRSAAAALLGVVAVTAAAGTARADDEPGPSRTDRFLPGARFTDARTVHVTGTVHLVDVDPFFDEDDRCDLPVGVDLLAVTTDPGGPASTSWTGDCDGAHGRLTVSARTEADGAVSLRLYLDVDGGSNFSIFDTGIWDDLVTEAALGLRAGETTGVHMDAGASSHAEGTADLDVSVD